MVGRFLVSDEQLASIRSTRQGRISLAGYNYQCSYAVARLASMLARRPVLGLHDWPVLIRYDWGEDLDEICDGDQLWFTQCKCVDDIAQVGSLTQVLLGFAPKWLWTPNDRRERVHFRLVSTDKRFLQGGRLDACYGVDRAGVVAKFLRSLETPPSTRQDRASWQLLADVYGHEKLLNDLWTNVFALYLASDEDGNDPAGRILPGERYGLDLLLRHRHLSSAQQADALSRLRRIIHDNLIEFDPTNDRLVDPPSQSPRMLDHGDVAAGLFVDRPRTRALPFAVVDRVYLSDQREKPKTAFVARPPEWRDVVHGTDDRVKFVERDQTEQLKEAVQRNLLDPIAHGTADFPSLFACGSPGAGKSALVRRVAALLVEEGQVVIADAGLNLSDPPDDLDLFCQHLSELAETERTVLLILDDPLFEESGWIDLLYKLKRPGLRVAAFAATPQFLFDRFKARLGKLRVHRFDVAGASPAEKRHLARASGRDELTFGTDTDDFFVLSMEAYAGEPFDTIIDKLWITLNGGVPFTSPDTPLKAFPWALRAFLIVCFFHRLYLACPKPLLQVALTLSGGTGTGINVQNAVKQLEHADGWKIFQLCGSVHPKRALRGPFIMTSHPLVALRAWERRPVPWLDGELCGLLAQVSIQVPQTARRVGSAAALLATRSISSDDEFVKRLVSIWSKAIELPHAETRFICELVSVLPVHHARMLSDVLLARATPSPDGWLAALALWFLSSDDAKQRSFSPSLDLETLVKTADFSVAPHLATNLANRLCPNALKAFFSRLLQSIDGELPWKLDSYLLTWLLAKGPRASSLTRVDAVQRWLAEHPADTNVRTQYLVFLLQLPKEEEFDGLRRQAATDTARWLADHPTDTVVRTQYLAFLQQLPREELFDALRRSATEQTADGLRRPENEYATDVRTQFLSFFPGFRKSLANCVAR